MIDGRSFVLHISIEPSAQLAGGSFTLLVVYAERVCRITVCDIGDHVKYNLCFGV